ncbi:hypothetical protein ACFFGH_32385 [Lysobacter korlensis]|uniref:Uncharacterized protein n=1 Tax=Lysobacter korlensis TaxID=553636 RepID=A0ABV6S150_9GAMM
MQQFGRYLTYSLLATLLALPAGAVAAGLAVGLFGFFSAPDSALGLAQNIGIGLFSAIPAVLLGLVPALVWGAPAYAALAAQGRESFLSATIVGALPGLLILPAERQLGVLFILFGVPVALCTHALARRRVRALRNHGSNNSSKPKPLRGSA